MFTKITRDEAHAKGLKRFYTGVPCKREHDCERFVVNGGCVECVNRSTPHKRKGIVAVNAAWPRTALVFQTLPAPSVEEMQAAIAYVQEVGWLDAALDALRKDPALMAQYTVPPSPVEIEAAQALLARTAVASPRPVKTGGMTPERIAEWNARLPK